jgi:hypothetical protein
MTDFSPGRILQTGTPLRLIAKNLGHTETCMAEKHSMRLIIHVLSSHAPLPRISAEKSPEMPARLASTTFRQAVECRCGV